MHPGRVMVFNHYLGLNHVGLPLLFLVRSRSGGGTWGTELLAAVVQAGFVDWEAVENAPVLSVWQHVAVRV